ncbi:hypothetical protein BRARA_D00326 [Brassica rapa]|uniref:Uncharacterized protein n=1 Tax=Brassica campestris TaxID=3711 RepID=A0A397ZPV9_BRACM|nr:hypothetical protein BRARA_D00326 [Brassica rapa]
MAHISDIKLIKTDTTLDLSQKAEKEPDGGSNLPPPTELMFVVHAILLENAKDTVKNRY